MGIEENDVFTLEWVAVVESQTSWAGVISLECYGALQDTHQPEILVSLGGLKSRASLNLKSGECYLPLESWQQVVISSCQALEAFVMQIMINYLNFEVEDAEELTIGLIAALDDGCDIRPTDHRLN